MLVCIFDWDECMNFTFLHNVKLAKPLWEENAYRFSLLLWYLLVNEQHIEAFELFSCLWYSSPIPDNLYLYFPICFPWLEICDCVNFFRWHFIKNYTLLVVLLLCFVFKVVLCMSLTKVFCFSSWFLLMYPTTPVMTLGLNKF